MTIRQKRSAIKKLIRFVKSKRFGPDEYKGLCSSAYILFQVSMINTEEYKYLTDLIDSHPSIRMYYWKPGLKKPRINWLEEKMRELK